MDYEEKYILSINITRNVCMERTVATFEIPQLHEKLVDSSANLQYKAKMLKSNKKN